MGRMQKETAEARLERLRLAFDPAAREALLTELLMVDALPIVDGALRHRRETIHAGDREDLRAQVLVRLLRRLTAAGEQHLPIERYEDYVATVTYHVVDDYVRARNPEGARIANRIRFLLRHDRRFEIWDVRGEPVCGLAAWTGRPAGSLDETDRFIAHQIDARVLFRFFRDVGTPLSLKELIAHATSRSLLPPAASVFEITSEDRAFGRIETRQLLSRLWDEIGLLPPQQRIALLLSIRDSRSTSVLAVFPAAEIASLEDIAQTIGWEPADLAAIWNALPLDDDRIGAMLELTRQQVINLRKSARARLTRRMEQWS